MQKDRFFSSSEHKSYFGPEQLSRLRRRRREVVLTDDHAKPVVGSGAGGEPSLGGGGDPEGRDAAALGEEGKQKVLFLWYGIVGR